MPAIFAKFTSEAAFDTFEKDQESKLGYPAKPINQKTKQERKDVKEVTVYTTAIKHPSSGEVICKIDSNADTTGITTITEVEAVSQGFIDPPLDIEIKDGKIFVNGKEHKN